MNVSKKEMENALNVDIGKLLDLKNLKRDDVAESIGMSPSNLIAALKGRRPLPFRYFNSLVELLGLNHKIKLKEDFLHVLTVSKPNKQYYYCYEVLHILSDMPMKQVALLDIIGEKSKSFAYVLRTKKNAWIVIMDEAKFLQKIDEDDYDEVFFLENKDDKTNQKLFLVADYSLRKEISLSHYNAIIQDKNSLQKIQEFLSAQDAKVWTWNRIREKAESIGLSPEEIVKKLNLDRHD